MRKMPVISSDEAVNDRITRICGKFDYVFEPVFFDKAEPALEYLKYELPEVNVINFADAAVDPGAVLDLIKSDPWLHYGGIIGIHRGGQEQKLAEHMPDSNIVSLIPRGQFVSSFFRVLRIVVQNRQILFQRGIQSYLTGTISGNLVMDNDPFNVHTYANLVTNFLYNSHYIDYETKERLHVALFEMLMNAIEHGNCRITYEEKSRWLDSHGDIIELIRSKAQDPEIRRKRVHFTYRITPERSFFRIRDEGEGFDWRSRVAAGKNGPNLSLHGHGIMMTSHYMENLQYNDAGNEVSFELSHANREVNAVPGIFRGQEETRFRDRDVVFTEGEESNYLYYIIAGKLDVYSGGEHLTTLGPEDMFLGEMSFLLNDKRSATVISRGPSSLTRISKNDFVNAIKENPHYGIFLARLLAQRLSRLNVRVARMKEAEQRDHSSVVRTDAL
ncbi:MAG: cyclic nucleotide-binding domain-containing protein [Spirochaetaceae bacterium]